MVINLIAFDLKIKVSNIIWRWYWRRATNSKTTNQGWTEIRVETLKLEWKEKWIENWKKP